MLIAVTGGLGTGKSTAAKLLANTLDCDIVDTDQLCRHQLEPGAESHQLFRKKFGNEYIQIDGTIDRDLLRRAVFCDPLFRTELEGILHPIVQRQVMERAALCSSKGKNLVVEVPLLYEVGWQDHFDICVVVYLSEKICIDRVIRRDNLTPSVIEKIIVAQMPLDQKRSNADFVVDNSGTFVSMAQQINWLARNLYSK